MNQPHLYPVSLRTRFLSSLLTTLLTIHSLTIFKMSSYNNTGALASPLPSPPGPAPSTVTMPIQNTALDTPATVTTGGSTSAQSATRKSTRARKSAPSMPAGDSQASATVPATSVRRSTRRASAAATCRISSQMVSNLYL
ncbi:hypothetical protein F5Y06DRAFT_266479 [Hypoxylon sp. FL0890]|nr:hypothetical protein F5Y06DRAFT_266479 [Hypoxylon sp. FL0890]